MNVLPPGGYTYVQPDTGMAFGGNETFKPQCRLILAHRVGNALARATLAEVGEDLVAHTCKRVPGICMEDGTTVAFDLNGVRVTTSAVRSAVAPVKKKCGTCGGSKRK